MTSSCNTATSLMLATILFAQKFVSSPTISHGGERLTKGQSMIQKSFSTKRKIYFSFFLFLEERFFLWHAFQQAGFSNTFTPVNVLVLHDVISKRKMLSLSLSLSHTHTHTNARAKEKVTSNVHVALVCHHSYCTQTTQTEPTACKSNRTIHQHTSAYVNTYCTQPGEYDRFNRLKQYKETHQCELFWINKKYPVLSVSPVILLVQLVSPATRTFLILSLTAN